MTRPLVTLCVPTIGRPGTLRQTLDCVMGQSHDNLEVLLLDNACGPEAQQVIQEYVDGDPRARVLRSDHRLPMFENFARGVVAARGTYLTFFHDDDVYRPDFVEREAALLEAHPEVAFCGSNWEVIDEAARVLRRRALVKKTAVWPGRRYILALLRTGVNIIPMPGVMFRRAVLTAETFTRYSQPGCTDFVLLMRIAEDHDVGLIDDCLMQIRSHGDQASRSLPPDVAARLLISTFGDYCADISARRPLEEDFIRAMRKSALRGTRRALLWGWLTAGSDQDARRCARALDTVAVDRVLGHALLGLGRAGLGGASSRRAMTSTVRWLGNSLLSRALLVPRRLHNGAR